MRPNLSAPAALLSGAALFGVTLCAGAAPYRVAMLQIEGDPPASSGGMSMFAEPSPTVLDYAEALRDAWHEFAATGRLARS